MDALQKVGMRHRPSRQRWATEILKATKGTDLTRLKAFVDDGGVSSNIILCQIHPRHEQAPSKGRF